MIVTWPVSVALGGRCWHLWGMPITRARRHFSVLRGFICSEAGGGVVLMGMAALAMVLANSAAAPGYFDTLHRYVAGLSLLHWINDGLMAGFFLLIGLEIKRELTDGALARWHDRVLPGLCAIAGMALPALIYAGFNHADGEAVAGWAIPAATDIAFSLGILALLGPRVPVSLRLFLTAVAVLDDLLAVMVIAVFYTPDLSLPMLGLAGVVFVALLAFNRAGIGVLWPYLLLGVPLWVCVFFSGVHATVAGVLLALVIPLRRSPGRPDDPHSPLHRLEHAIQPWIAYLVLPVFGLANAGVPLGGLNLAAISHPVTVGVAVGLFVGKQVGIFGAVLLAARLGWAQRPRGASWRQVHGVAVLCGVGFTMSLFIGLLAFPEQEALQQATKLGVLAGSLLSGLAGWVLLYTAPSRVRRAESVPAGRTQPR